MRSIVVLCVLGLSGAAGVHAKQPTEPPLPQLKAGMWQSQNQLWIDGRDDKRWLTVASAAGCTAPKTVLPACSALTSTTYACLFPAKAISAACHFPKLA